MERDMDDNVTLLEDLKKRVDDYLKKTLEDFNYEITHGNFETSRAKLRASYPSNP
jgi:16S rRNA G527 N7-methylase RsmG